MRPLQRQLNFSESLQSYGSFFVRCLKASFAYRSTTVINISTTAVFYAITIMIWSHVYTQKAGMTISSTQMFVYLLLAACVNYALGGMVVEFRIGNRIRNGLIATDLLKPVDFQISQGIQALSEGLFNASLVIVIFILGFLVFGTQIFPADLPSFLLFIPSFLMGFIIMYGIGFVFVQAAFYTYSGYGIFAARNALQATFSGIFAPISFYPSFIKTTMEWLPFRHTIYTPISIYMGWVKGVDAYSLIFQQAAWIVGLLILGRILMKHALKQLEVQGG